MDTANTGITRDADDTSIGRWGELFEHDTDHQYVSDGLIGRATELIDGIGGEARARGFRVEEPSKELFDRAKRNKWAWPHIMASTQDGHLLSFHISERSRTGTEPKTRTMTDRHSPDGVPTWQMRRSTSFAPTGVLSVRVDSDMDHYRLKTIRDSVNTLVETRLPNLFDAVTGELVRCDEVSRRAREQRERDEDAKRRCYIERMYAALCDEVARHERMQAQRDYLDQVERRLDSRREDGDGIADDGSPDVRTAIASMRAHIDERDPLTDGGTGWTNQPEPTESELFEYAHRAIPSVRRGMTPSAPPRDARERHASRSRSAASGRVGFFD